MHGISRDAESLLTGEEKATRAKKTLTYIKLKDEALAMHKRKQYDDAALQLSAQLLTINPDFYTLFNWRKLIIDHTITQFPARLAEICENELKLMEVSLLKNPKSYYAWHHREWIMQKGTTDVKREMALVTKFLSMDTRNFHGWAYRRVVAQYAMRAGLITDSDEFLYTTTHININFSNYSAWHYRTALILRLLAAAKAAPASVNVPNYDFTNVHAVLDKEFELVKNAFWTAPQDQSAWLYHRWLIARALSPSTTTDGLDVFNEHRSLPLPSGTTDAAEVTWQYGVLQRELLGAAELLEVEPNCKWVILTHSALLVAFSRLVRSTAANATAAVAAASTSAPSSSMPAATTVVSTVDTSIAAVTLVVNGAYDHLISIDNVRAQFYNDTRAALLRQLQL